MKKKVEEISGFLFDVYLVENLVHIWLIDHKRRVNHFIDDFYPEIFLDAGIDYQKRFAKRLLQLNALYEKPVWVKKKHLYKNVEIQVGRYRLSKPSLLKKISRRLYAFYGKAELYHSDLEPSFMYFLQREIYPMARVKIKAEAFNRVQSIALDEDPGAFEYDIPRFCIMEISLSQSHRMFYSSANYLIVKVYYKEQVLFRGSRVPVRDTRGLLLWLNEILIQYNPDIILSSFGDQIIFPELFSLAQKHRIHLMFDRDHHSISRVIQKKGSSYSSYGNVIFRAPSYPLFGRWHIDSKNSFLYKESDTAGILELARLSRLPVQKMARSSTGMALTAMQSEIALKKGYLIPWQKSHVEEPKTAWELLRIDKGGLVYEPDVFSRGKVIENVAQLDFEQMYPTIMVIHNISPETVLCQCCQKDPLSQKVPESGYHICRKRKGIVSLSIEPLLKRRKYLKNKKKRIRKIQESVRHKKKHLQLQKKLQDSFYIADVRQMSLKWLLVTCFGYLGYRNAKFGRLESHESVQAFGREKLLKAKEIAEESGFSVIHAITDCIFIQDDENGARLTERHAILAEKIKKETNISISVDGIYSWLVFPDSKSEPGFPVANRYFGLFESEDLKIRGLLCRRKDMPHFIKNSQKIMLLFMKRFHRIDDLKKNHKRIERLYRYFDQKIYQKKVPLKHLFFRRNIGKEASHYKVNNASSVTVAQILEQNKNREKKDALNIIPGEKVEYIICKGKVKYLAKEIAENKKNVPYDVDEYRRWLLKAYQEIWEPFAPPGYFMRKEEEFLSFQEMLPETMFE